MEGLLLLLILGFIVLVFVLPIRAAIRSGEAVAKADALDEKVREMSAHMAKLRERVVVLEVEAGIRPAELSAGEERVAAEKAARESAPVQETPSGMATPPVVPPAIEPDLRWTPPGVESPPPAHSGHEAKTPGAVGLPPPLPQAAKLHAEVPQEPLAAKPAMAPVSTAAPKINLEQFMGVKLFAWFGGLALFFGVVFFVKYAFEHNLISPAMRVAIGFLTGITVLAVGVRVQLHKNYVVLGQSLCATGVLILYGVSYAAHALYQLPLFDTVPTFFIMSLVTVVAFVLAVRMNALVVAILGMLGGFLTPILVSTGKDQVFALFSYIAVLDAGLLAVARRRNWPFLAPLAALGTVIMQVGWYVQFFDKGGYANGMRTLIPMGICVLFAVLFLAAAWRARKRGRADLHPICSALGLCAVALMFGFAFSSHEAVSARPLLLYGYVFLINLVALAAVVIEPRFIAAQGVACMVTFLHLASWTAFHLKEENLLAALAVYLVFGLLHAMFPFVWRRLAPDAMAGVGRAFGDWAPSLSLVLILLPFMKLEAVSYALWIVVLLLNLTAIALAVSSRKGVSIVVSLVLTLLAVGLWLFQLPKEPVSLWPFLSILGGFSAFFAVAGTWLTARTGNRNENEDPFLQSIPVLSAIFPFLLLMMAVTVLQVPNPSPVFGLGLLLLALLLGVGRFAHETRLSAIAIGAMVALQVVWHAERFDAAQPWIPLVWYAGLALLFAVHPFVFKSAFSRSTIPWTAAAVSGIGQFLLVYNLVKRAFPNDVMGLVPAVFAIPPALSLAAVLRMPAADENWRKSLLAWYGGVTLLFITLIVPIQFDRQWITLGWALEGAALCWLFLRVPHEGLRITGAALLAVAFVRLSLNPAVLAYQPRGDTPIWNWQLYAYILAAAAQFAGAWWLRPPRHRLGELHAPAFLWSFGGILLFLLLNIEIADAFTQPGAKYIAFQFSGNFARDMTYSIAWALFALALIMLGFWLRVRGARYAGIGLMAVTLLKLFLHDLASIESIYRIAALIVVAVIALAASFLYQRFGESADSAARE